MQGSTVFPRRGPFLHLKEQPPHPVSHCSTVFEYLGKKRTMRYHALAVDYDGTIAHHGQVPTHVIEALRRVKASRRKILLVTGRELDELKHIFPEHDIFDLIVAENGALIYDPVNGEETKLGETPPLSFVDDLRKRGVQRISTGRVIVATWEPYQHVVLEAIRNSGVERQVIFNKGAVMILPPGVNKATGLEAALKKLDMAMHNVVVAGDAENDTAMFLNAECAVCVANGLPAVKEQADWVTGADHGDGVIELIDRLLGNDLADMEPSLQRHCLLLGNTDNGKEYFISPYRNGILLAGSSGGGKTTLTTSFVEALAGKKYQFCLVDPEGDYTELANCVVIGDAAHSPVMDEIITILKDGSQNLVICLLGIKLNDRPGFIKSLVLEVGKLISSKGHPHWLILDEVHHLFPIEVESSFFNIPTDLKNFLMITMSPDQVNRDLMRQTDMLVIVGDEPQEALEEFGKVQGLPTTGLSIQGKPKGMAWIWDPKSGEGPFPIRFVKPHHLLQRHKKKYATGDMKENSFYFTGPSGKLNLKAQNLAFFSQIAEGIDDETWSHHLQRNEYSAWIRNSIGDQELAEIIRKEEDKNQEPLDSKRSILKHIGEKYTLGGK
jgi:HAD superfamily hydrolase (TIGR01484 family)